MFVFYKESQLINVDDDAENDLLVNTIMLMISHIASLNKEITGFFFCFESLFSPSYLRIHLNALSYPLAKEKQ